MVLDHKGEHAPQWAAISSIAAKIGCSGETLRNWIRNSERDSGMRGGPSTDERERIKALERENRELRQANEWTCFGLVESGLVGVSFLELDGADEAERAMQPTMIIEAIDVAGQGLDRLSPGLEDGAPDKLALQCLEKRLDHSIIITITPAGH